MKRDDFTVGWICAIGIELAAVLSVLDERYPTKPSVPATDENVYEYGKIGGHNVVLTCLPHMGILQAGIVATRMRSTFTRIRFVLMVGVGGGAPSKSNDVRLGDIVISNPAGRCSGVVQYDFGKAMENGEFLATGWLNSPPAILLSAASAMKARGKEKLAKVIWDTYENLEDKKDFSYPGEGTDNLYEADCLHNSKESCEDCDPRQIVPRKERPDTHPRIHYGIIASANQVMKDGKRRNDIIKETLRWTGAEALCFEMEAAGLMNDFSCLVVRGICDYSDGHKNKVWQPYAAINAAIYAKELLKQVSPVSERGLVEDARTAPDYVAPQDISSKLRFKMPFHIPFTRNTAFTGRVETLRDIHEYFTESHDTGVPLIYAITGAGGMGKTQIAIEYAYQHLNDFPAVYWVDATSERTMCASFVKILECIVQEQARAVWGDSTPDYKAVARELGIEGHVDDEGRVRSDHYLFGLVRVALFNWLGRPQNKRWLLIIDNADDLDEFNKLEYLPNRGSGSVLITSRRPRANLLRMQTAQKADLDGLDLDSAVKLVLGLTNLGDKGKDLAVKSSAIAIVTELGFMPLAITQAAYYIWKEGIPLEEYLPRYRKDFMQVQGSLVEQPKLREQPKPEDEKPCFGSTYRETTTKTWEISLSAVEKQDKEAVSILLTSAYLNHEEIFGRIWVDKEDGRSEERVRDEFRKRIELLASYSLVKIGDEGAFSIHPVMHLWARERLDAEARRQVLGNAIVILGKVSRWDKLSRESQNWSLSEERRFTSHLQSLCRYSDLDSLGLLHNEAQKSKDDNIYFAFRSIGSLLEKQERYPEATIWYKRALVGLEFLGDKAEILKADNGVIVGFLRQNMYEDAAVWLKRAGRDSMLTGVVEPIMFEILSNMANVLVCVGNYDEALRLYHASLATAEQLRLQTNLVIESFRFQTMHNIAAVFKHQGNLMAAEEWYNRALEGLMGWLKPGNGAANFDIMIKIASNFGERLNYHAALDWYQKALNILGKGLDETHPRQVAIVEKMAACLNSLEKHGEARALYEKALTGYKSLHEEGHRDSKYFLLVDQLALCHWCLKEYSKALGLFLEVLKYRETSAGEDNLLTLITIDYVAKCHFQLGNYDDALQLCRRLFNGRNKLFGPGHYQTVEAMDNIATVLVRKGELAEARQWLDQVRNGIMNLFGANSPQAFYVTKQIEAILASPASGPSFQNRSLSELPGRPAGMPVSGNVPGFQSPAPTGYPNDSGSSTPQTHAKGSNQPATPPCSPPPPYYPNATPGQYPGYSAQNQTSPQNYGSPGEGSGQPKYPNNQQTASYNQTAGLYQQQAAGYNQQNALYSQQAVQYNQQNGQYNPQAAAYNQQNGQYNPQAAAYIQNLAAYGRQINPYNQQAGFYNQQAMAYNQQAGPYNQARFYNQ
ncbi:hypothetical protein TWF730_002542 [Orbilia blumenaviensis]|uniref:Nucleoside phosphorylase domain-containing protein n=1 Tax=Orbilia blumenaviensis TaxID=1796055 RepID=A0AAV9UCG1_9PEZI